MPVYRYKAIDRDGFKSEGEIEVPNKKELEVYLNARGLYLESMNRDKLQIALLTKRVKLRDVIIFSRQFAIMIHAGISVGEAMKILSTFTTNQYFSSVLKEIEYDLSVGVTVSDSMKKHDDVFKYFFTSMMQVGEFSGELDTVLKKTADYYEDEGRLMKKIRSALTYPIILLVLIVVLVAFTMNMIMPTFETMFKSMNVKLPAVTSCLINVSHFFQSYGLFVIGGICAAAYILYRYYKTDNGKYKVDKTILIFPVLKEVYQKTTTARFARSMNILLNSGITIVQSFDIIDSLMSNRIIRERFTLCKESVNLGYSYHMSLKKMEFFPDILTNMVAVGEKTGSLGEVFDKTSTFFQEEADEAIDRLVAMIEPIMLVVVGSIILVIFLAVMLPMFDILNNIK